MPKDTMRSTIVGLTGDAAAADAMRQINPDLVAAYPITPQTEIVERFAEYVADGKVNTELVAVESEHSALTACCGGAAAGGRVMTCTASQGLALMHEVLFIAAGNRLPMVMPTVNRTLSAPINIHGDHSDTMGSRECGWIQIFSLDAQEVYDLTIQAVRISEHPDVQLPVMVTMDGFIVSHDMERVEIMDDASVKTFIGERQPAFSLLDRENPVDLGALVGPPLFFEHKVNQIKAMEGSLAVIEAIGKEYGELTGRFYGAIDPYLLDDADVAIVAMSSGAGTARVAVDQARAKGIKAGILRLRSFRPFPVKQVVEALKGIKAVAVLDRSSSPGAVGSPLFEDIRTALYDLENRPKTVSLIFGLGGRDLTPEMVAPVLERLDKIAKGGPVGRVSGYLGLRE
jgi:pyruvate ferredoxin oxidoreductase alpha subunit